jgi:hypothetical protein
MQKFVIALFLAQASLAYKLNSHVNSSVDLQKVTKVPAELGVSEEPEAIGGGAAAKPVAKAAVPAEIP